jgi:hypothetical protein
VRTTLLASWLVVVAAVLPSAVDVPAAAAQPSLGVRPRCVVVHEPAQHRGVLPPRSTAPGGEALTLSIPLLRCDTATSPGASSRSADRLPRTGTELVVRAAVGLGAGAVLLASTRGRPGRHTRRRRHLSFSP